MEIHDRTVGTRSARGDVGWSSRAPGGPGRDVEPPPVSPELERRVDRVLSEHRTLLATMERDLPAHVREGLFELRMPVPGTKRARGATTTTTTVHRTFSDVTEGLAADEGILQARRDRARLVADLQPTEYRPATAKPLVTRGGVFYVAPRFEQARGFGEVADARLLHAGFLSSDAVLKASPDELVRVTGHPLETVLKARDDLDLTRLPGVDRVAADMLRFVGVHSLSRLAERDPEFLARDLGRIRDEHRFFRFPHVLDGEAAIRRLVSRARDLAP